MRDRQPDLFSPPSDAPAPSLRRPAPTRPSLDPASLADAALIAAIADAGVAEAPPLAAEAARRKLSAAVRALDRLCRRFAGHGTGRAIPEQIAALDGLAAIGGNDAADAVAGLIAKGAVRGANLHRALDAAARLQAVLPPAVIAGLLREDDPVCRAGACRCARRSPAVIERLVALLDDLNEPVGQAAACALGRMGRPEARPALHRLLRDAPTAEAIDAVAVIADEESLVILGRVARRGSDLAAAVLAALAVIDHPRAERLAAGIRGGA